MINENNMNKICTTIEQSKKLVELGIDVSTADMLYAYTVDIQTGEWELGKTPVIIDGSIKIDPSHDVPAWSLTKLINLIPKIIGDYNRVFRMDVGELDTSMWYDELGSGVDSDLPDITMNSMVDTAFEMICKLKENKKL